MAGKEVVRLLENIALYMEILGENPFKVSAFRRAASVLKTLEIPLEKVWNFTEIPGIGKATASVIEEFLRTGTSSLLRQLQEQVPPGLLQLRQIRGLGGKSISRFYKELGITDAEGLRKACLKGKIRRLKGFGRGKEQQILAEIEKLTSFPGRIPISTALEAAERMESHLQEMEGVIRFSRAGSLRRMNETVKDLNYVIATENSESVKNGLLAFPGSRLIAGGKTKVTIRFGHGGMELSADFRLVRPEVFVCALHHFTGSKAHNGRLRHLAKCRGEKIKKYGVERNNPPKLLTFPSEEAFFRHFGLPYIAPELREDGNEIDRTEELDTLIDKWDIKGDLHLHSNWSDGEDTLVAMIEEGRKRGYEYIAFTDHSRSLRIAGGLSVDRLLRQMETIRNWNEQYEDIEILCGAEVDILPDGNLDYPDRVLKELDIVIASIHSGFSQREDELMKRLASACRNPFVHIIAHPTGRIIGRRGGYPVKIGQLLRLAVETGTILELNANPNRLDPPKEFLQQAQGAGVKIAINTDAHSTKALENMEIGVAHARKAWLRKDSVINTLPLQSLLQFIHPGSVFRNRKE